MRIACSHGSRPPVKGAQARTLAVLDEGDASGAVGVVLYALHHALLPRSHAAEVHEAQQPLVAAAAVPRRDPARPPHVVRCPWRAITPHRITPEVALEQRRMRKVARGSAGCAGHCRCGRGFEQQPESTPRTAAVQGPLQCSCPGGSLDMHSGAGAVRVAARLARLQLAGADGGGTHVPVLLRPPVLRLPKVSGLKGLPFHRPSRRVMTLPRMAAPAAPDRSAQHPLHGWRRQRSPHRACRGFLRSLYNQAESRLLIGVPRLSCLAAAWSAQPGSSKGSAGSPVNPTPRLAPNGA